MTWASALVFAAALLACEDVEPAASATSALQTGTHPDPAATTATRAEAVEKAPAAAAEEVPAAAAEGDLCERAFAEVSQMIRAARALSSARGAPELPDEGRFMEACGAVPSEIQQCLVMSYATQHMEECRAHVAALDGPTRARADALMRAALAPAS